MPFLLIAKRHIIALRMPVRLSATGRHLSTVQAFLARQCRGVKRI
jgi:hypothetical protein